MEIHKNYLLSKSYFARREKDYLVMLFMTEILWWLQE
jgi:hypothetical protein